MNQMHNELIPPPCSPPYYPESNIHTLRPTTPTNDPKGFSQNRRAIIPLPRQNPTRRVSLRTPNIQTSIRDQNS
jgi:hypothetical protein